MKIIAIIVAEVELSWLMCKIYETRHHFVSDFRDHRLRGHVKRKMDRSASWSEINEEICCFYSGLWVTTASSI